MYKPRHIQLTVPDPCRQDWDKMKEDTGGKFCDQCSKQVIDFTTWTDTELYNYFYRRDEHVCGRFLSTQLNRSIRIPYQPHSKLYRIAVALGAALLFTQVPEAKAHARPPMVWAQQATNDSDTILPTDATTAGLTGQLFDNKKEPVVNASVLVKQNDIVKGAAVTDFDGNYVIMGLAPGNYDVTFSYVGHTPKTIAGVVISNNEQTKLNAILDRASGRQVEVIMGGRMAPLTDPYRTDTTSNKQKKGVHTK